MIGYYIHHRGRGHLHRAQALAAALDEPVTGLSSLPRPEAWCGPWVQLGRDDTDPSPDAVTAGGQLHWVPRSDPGVRSRVASISSWLDRVGPRLVVVDVSVEVTLLVRLHGVPVVTIVLPGVRTDPAHLLGFGVSDALVADWPASADADAMTPGLPKDVADRITCVGAVSRFPVVHGDQTETAGARAPRTPGPPRVAVLQGQGGGLLTSRTGDRLRALAPEWEWTGVGGPSPWLEDPTQVLRAADVVVTNAGQGSVADVAGLGRPAVIIPAERPFEEQAATARALASGDWPAIVLSDFPELGWPALLDRAAALDGTRWRDWCDGRAAARFADVVAGLPTPGSAVDLRSA